LRQPVALNSTHPEQFDLRYGMPISEEIYRLPLEGKLARKRLMRWKSQVLISLNYCNEKLPPHPSGAIRRPPSPQGEG